jgi:hypothetical protein
MYKVHIHVSSMYHYVYEDEYERLYVGAEGLKRASLCSAEAPTTYLVCSDFGRARKKRRIAVPLKPKASRNWFSR